MLNGRYIPIKCSILDILLFIQIIKMLDRFTKLKTGEKINELQEENLSFLRKPLLKYALRYQDTYPFDLLTPVETYLDKILQQNEINIASIDQAIKDLIEIGRFEHHFSLIEISDALSILVNTENLNKGSVIQVINHILEAFSCNLEEKEFIESEDEYLMKLIFPKS